MKTCQSILVSEIASFLASVTHNRSPPNYFSASQGFVDGGGVARGYRRQIIEHHQRKFPLDETIPARIRPSDDPRIQKAIHLIRSPLQTIPMPIQRAAKFRNQRRLDSSLQIELRRHGLSNPLYDLAFCQSVHRLLNPYSATGLAKSSSITSSINRALSSISCTSVKDSTG